MRSRVEVAFRAKDPQVAAQRCAEQLTLHLSQLAEVQERVVLALCGGSSPTHFYAALTDSLPTLHETLRSKLRFIPLDERCVEDSDSHYSLPQIHRQLLQPLLSRGAIEQWQIQWYEFAGSLELSLELFQQQFADLGSHIDVVIAGSGEDGHIASLFPEHAALEEQQRRYLLVTDSPKPPPARITASRKTITDAALCVGIFLRGKEEAFANFKDEQLQPEACPAKLLQQYTGSGTRVASLEPSVFVITDILS